MEKLKEYVKITFGALCVALGLQLFFVPHNLVTGGVSGLAIIILDISGSAGFPIPIWVTNMAFNLPMLLMSFKLMGRDIFIKSIYTIGMLTFFLAVTEHVPYMNPDFTLSTVFGGAIVGYGTALIIGNGATSGGTTMGAVLLNRLFKTVKVTKLILILDVIVILLGLLMFGPINTMYAIISIFITIKVTDMVIAGVQIDKAVWIISLEHKKISEALIANVQRGVTAMPARGVYTDNHKEMLLVVLSQRELVLIKSLVKEIDPNAFLIVSSVSEVRGQGFKPLDDKGLV